MEISLPIQVAGLGLLVLFAGTFGFRWAVLALALVLLFVGFVLSGVKVTLDVRVPGRKSVPAPGRGQ